MPLTQVDQGLLSSTAQYTGFKNRIINGAMQIDQRNAGASVSWAATTGSQYFLDRYIGWIANGSTAAATGQRSSTAPAGFINSLLWTVTAAQASLGSSFYSMLWQKIEGFNTADFGWGTASAQSVTLSFWVRSSVTGSFGGSIMNSAQNRSYPFLYTISAANTWEQKSITITGDTSGTWNTDNTTGIIVNLALGMGSGLVGTANTWSGSTYYAATGAANLYATNGSTFYITGVQLEKGSTATSFDYRPYGTELQLCQRYFQSFKRAGEDNNCGWLATSYNANSIYMPVQFFTIMRRVPDVLSGGSWRTRQSNLNIFTASFAYQQSGTGGCVLAQSGSTNPASSVFWVEPDGSFSSAYLAFNGEL